MNEKNVMMLVVVFVLSVIVISGIYVDSTNNSEDEQRDNETDVSYKYGESLNETLRFYENQSAESDKKYEEKYNEDPKYRIDAIIKVNNKTEDMSRVVKKVNNSAESLGYVFPQLISAKVTPEQVRTIAMIDAVELIEEEKKVASVDPVLDLNEDKK
jgi:hypothetical protein